jgi:type IV secretion system protein TrbF
MRLGLQMVTTEVTSVVRASSGSFEIHWQEQTFENGVVIKSDRYTCTAGIIFGPRSEANMLQNPLGLFVNTLSWSRDAS